MAEVKPFRGLRFSAEAGDLRSLVAPPYDVIGPTFREELAVRSAHNVVHLTLPEQRPDDRSKFVKYARSAAALTEWRKDGTLETESRPAFYRYTQTFTIPYLAERAFVRTAVIALIKVEPYEKGVVLPHEQTFPKHKEDRLRILEATRAHLECIFGLYEDPGGEIHRRLLESPVKVTVEVVSDDGVGHRLEPITDPSACEALSQLLADKKIWIADGHHRYETALAFREALGAKPGPVAEDYMMMALTSMSDPGLVLLPTHRVVQSLPFPPEEIVDRLEAAFDLKEMHSSRLFGELRAAEARGEQVFGLAVRGGRGYIMRAHSPDAVAQLVGQEGSEALRGLDVTVLHRAILQELLEVEGLEGILYTREADEAVKLVEEGCAAAFLMNPPTVEDMRTIALGGEKMPQKSTYYFPKILSGLVLWSLNDF